MGIKYGDIEDASGQALPASGSIKYSDIQDEPAAAPEPRMVEMPMIGPGGEATGQTEMVETKEPRL
jgi:hypothetical protein